MAADDIRSLRAELEKAERKGDWKSATIIRERIRWMADMGRTEANTRATRLAGRYGVR